MDKIAVPASLARLRETALSIPDAIAEYDRLKARLDLAAASTSQAHRKLDTRRKIVIGALVLYAMETDPDLIAVIRPLLEKAKPRDWFLFEGTILNPNRAPYPVERPSNDQSAALNENSDDLAVLEARLAELADLIGRAPEEVAAASADVSWDFPLDIFPDKDLG